jgi:hypothetical protein
MAKMNLTGSAPQSPMNSTPSQGMPSAMNLPGESVKNVQSFAASDQGKQLAARIKSEFDKAQQARLRPQRQWYENMDMFFGKQNISTKIIGAAGTELIQRVQRNGRETPRSINRLRGVVRTEQAKLLSQKPTTTVIPATAEDEDFRMAQAAEQVVESYSATKSLRKHMEKAVWWASVTGNGFIKTWWDQNATDDFGNQGDICYGALSPFNVFVPDLVETDVEDQPFLIMASVKPLSWVQRVYGDILGGDVQAKASMNDIMDLSHLSLDASNSKPDSAMILEGWVKPGGLPGMDQGGFVMMVNDRIVQFQDQGLPYNHGQYPVSKIESIPTAKFYADSTLNDLIDLQREYNDLRHRIRENAKLMGSAQFAYERGSIKPGAMSNLPGAAVEVKPGRQFPQPLALPELPQYLQAQQDRILQDIEDVSGQHQVSKGAAPSGLTAGTAITALQERDDQYIQTTYDSLERAYEKTFGQTLSLFVQYVDLPRQIKVVGRDSQFDLLELQGADLKNSTDIRVESGSTVSQSKAAKQAWMLDLLQYGAISQEQFLEQIDVGGVKSILDATQVSKRQAQRENIKMKQTDIMQLVSTQDQFDMATEQIQQQMQMSDGVFDPSMAPPGMVDETGNLKAEQPALPVNEYDEHQIHIDVHNTFRRTQEFELLPDPIKREFENHVQAHQQLMQQSVLKNFLAQIPSDNSPDAGNPTGQPGEMPTADEDTQQEPDGAEAPTGGAPAGTLAGNGAAPAPEPASEGQINA